MIQKIILSLLFIVMTAEVYSFPTNEIELENLPEAQFQKLPSNEVDYLPELFTNLNNPKKVALYIGKGTWAFGKIHFKRLLYTGGFSYQVITAQDIISGKLNNRSFSALIMPGGKSWKYLKELGTVGAENIKSFVSQGGGYLGICAGAYYAVAQRQGPGLTSEPYGIGLLDGVAIDGTALKIKPFHGGMMNIDSLMEGFNKQFKILMLGGPAFGFSEKEKHLKNIKVLGLINPINYPTMIQFRFGHGQVFLMGPHGEIEETNSILGLIYKDPDSEWPFLIKILHEIQN